jgi:hypothetical protein
VLGPKEDWYRQLRLTPIDIFFQRQVTRRVITWKKTVLNRAVVRNAPALSLYYTVSTTSAVLSRPLLWALAMLADAGVSRLQLIKSFLRWPTQTKAVAFRFSRTAIKILRNFYWRVGIRVSNRQDYFLRSTFPQTQLPLMDVLVGGCTFVPCNRQAQCAGAR